MDIFQKLQRPLPSPFKRWGTDTSVFHSLMYYLVPFSVFFLWQRNEICLFCNCFQLKGLSHEIFTFIFWPKLIYLGLNGNRFWFLNFKEGSSILDNYFKYWCVSYQTFLEICRISGLARIDNWVRGSPIFLYSGLAVLQETLQRVSILLGDS